jgi:hypothetical protein
VARVYQIVRLAQQERLHGIDCDDFDSRSTRPKRYKLGAD